MSSKKKTKAVKAKSKVKAKPKAKPKAPAKRIRDRRKPKPAPELHSPVVVEANFDAKTKTGFVKCWFSFDGLVQAQK